ncbi:hypothetical protein AVEN_243651-1 [Araneus ventricosus]|uniref:RNase H type-1 domain-containing protein n=1 Tax=Araneus ventricosus TaxID=182803 RepID=A0A4Y2A5Z5_ARAVE|nr:hypothetical protein AVEN_243651-1 [Araneus ventricosus]
MERNAGSAFVALQDNTQMHEWMDKLQPENSVFMAELLAIHEAIIFAIEQNVVRNIWNDDMFSLLVSNHVKLPTKQLKQFKLCSPNIQI